MRNKSNIIGYLERITSEVQKIRSNNNRANTNFGDRREIEISVERIKDYIDQINTFLNQES